MPTPAPRVLVLPSSYFAQNRVVGGGERYGNEYSQALAGLTPTTLGLFDFQPATRTQGPLTIRHFTVTPRPPGELRFPATRATLAALREYDVIHLMCFPTPLSELLTPLARLRGQVVVLTDIGGGGRTLGGYLQKLHRRLDFHRLAHGLAHLSAHAKTAFPDWTHPDVILHGGTPQPDQFTEIPAVAYALFVGRLLPHKGILNVIQCLPAGVPLKVVGRPYDPAYFESLKAAAAGKDVAFITDADDAQLRRLYQGAAVVLQTSLPSPGPGFDRSELLGLVALEGMAYGRPVIVTRTTSLPELVVDGETGFIVPPHDLAALGTQIGRLVHDRELSRRLGRQALAHVRRNFTWEATARRGLGLYHALGQRLGKAWARA
jgi:glycosyltransferase involved in cell wall biosynthesis